MNPIAPPSPQLFPRIASGNVQIGPATYVSRSTVLGHHDEGAQLIANPHKQTADGVDLITFLRGPGAFVKVDHGASIHAEFALAARNFARAKSGHLEGHPELPVSRSAALLGSLGNLLDGVYHAIAYGFGY